ncbi:MAG: hypothetical protein ACI89U_003044, partial [Gammaproteobacteria bacterium]
MCRTSKKATHRIARSYKRQWPPTSVQQNKELFFDTVPKKSGL